MLIRCKPLASIVTSGRTNVAQLFTKRSRIDPMNRRDGDVSRTALRDELREFNEFCVGRIIVNTHVPVMS